MKPEQENLTVSEFQQICSDSIGLSVSAFKELGYSFRITHIDGNACVVTRDFKPTRFNLTIVNNVITECHGG